MNLETNCGEIKREADPFKLPAGSGSKREYRRSTIVVVVAVSVVLDV